MLVAAVLKDASLPRSNIEWDFSFSSVVVGLVARGLPSMPHGVLPRYWSQVAVPARVVNHDARFLGVFSHARHDVGGFRLTT